MFNTVRKTVIGVAALAALALGGAVVSNAATSGSASSSSSAPPQGYGQQGPPPGGRGGPHTGRHMNAQGQREQALPAADAAKVRAAA
jgi:hypothetical protein